MFSQFIQTILNFLYVCQSVSLAYFLTEIRLIKGYLQFWMRYLSEILQTRFQDISGLFLNYSEFLVCLSVYQLAYFLTEIMSIKRYLQFWMRYLPDFFGDILDILLDCFKIILNFLYVCQSVSYISTNWSFLGVNF